MLRARLPRPMPPTFKSSWAIRSFSLTSFTQYFALPQAAFLSYLVTYGEILVGIALILGLFTGVAAFFGGLMNTNYLMAGTVSSNPTLFVLATLLVLAWSTSGYYLRLLPPATGAWTAGCCRRSGFLERRDHC